MRWEKWPTVTRGVALGATLVLQIVLVVALTTTLHGDKILPLAEGESFLRAIAVVSVAGCVGLLLAARRGQ